jgi:hypothetical protein
MWLKVAIPVLGITTIQGIGAVTALIVSLGLVLTYYLARANSPSAVRGGIRLTRIDY